MENEIKEFTVDFLNLIFGKGEETSHFWEQVLIPGCIKKFGIYEAMKYH